MGNSIKILTVRGIAIRVHITFPLILLFAAYQYGQIGGTEGAIFGFIAITLLFVLVTLHELGHSFAALYYDVPVRQIVLLPIGGVAQLEKTPATPFQELVVAVAGPAVNIAIAFIMGLFVLSGRVELVQPLRDFSLTFLTFFSFIFYYNIILAVFNLLPAFPMDGGRVLRSLLAMAMNYERATTIAVNIGRAVAIVMGIYAVRSGDFFLGFIAIFIFFAGTQEMMMVRWRGRSRPFPVGQHTVQEAYSPKVWVLGPNDNLHQALSEQLRGWQSDFPVAEEGEYLGFVSEDSLQRAANLFGPDALIYAAIAPDLRPVPPQMDLVDAQKQMERLKVRALPVVEYGRLLGMLTYRQIHEFLHTRTVWSNNNDTPRIVGA